MATTRFAPFDCLIPLTLACLVACESQKGKPGEQANELTAKATNGAPTAASRIYTVHRHNGRIYVIGSSKTAEAFMKTKHLPYTHTMIGGGPKGETVIVEVDKKEPSLQKELWARFQKENLYYAEVMHDGRYYIVGSPETHAAFKKSPHLPYTRTKIGAGPNGETLVFEVDKKNDALANRLEARFWEQRKK